MMCLTCHYLNLQNSPRHTAVGYGKCAYDKSGEYQSFDIERNCSKYQEASQEVILKRKQWRDK